MAEQPPKGYRISHTGFWGEALFLDRYDGQPKEWFRLTDRTFPAINHYFGYLPSQFIEYLVGKLDRKLLIADIGGGKKSLCAQGIAEKYGDKAEVVNVDLIHVAEPHPGNVTPLKADACNIPLRTGGIDLALSFQFFPHLENDGQYTKGMGVIGEIARILRPGGVALIDENYICGLPLSDRRFIEVFPRTNTILSVRLGNRAEPGQIIFSGPGAFLMMEKLPIDYNLSAIRSKIFGHI